MLFFLSVLLDFFENISDKKYTAGLSHEKGRMMMFSERNVAMLHCHSYIVIKFRLLSCYQILNQHEKQFLSMMDYC